MEDGITVHVAGPRLLVQGICALLNGFPDLRTIEAVPFVLTKDFTATGQAPILVVVHPIIDRSEKCEVYPLTLRMAKDDPRPILLPLPHGYPVGRIVLVTSREELNLVAACAAGLRIFLGLEDDVNVLRQGILAGAHGEAYCSSSLALYFMESVRRHSQVPRAKRDFAVPLSRREREIAGLAALGLSNAEIAKRQFIGISTVKAHLTQVYGKLAICRRSQISAALRMIGED